MRWEIASKTTRRERKEELWCGLLRTQNIIPPLYDQVFFFVSSQCFFFFLSFLSSFPLFFFWFLISFPFVCVSFVCVCLLFMCLLFATLNPCSSHLFLSCLFFLSWVSWWMRLEMRFSSSFCLSCLFYLFFFLCSFVHSFLYCLFVSSLLFLFPLFPLPFHSPFPKALFCCEPLSCSDVFYSFWSLSHCSFLSNLPLVDSPLFCFSTVSFLTFSSKICFLTLIVLSYLECFPLLCFSLSFVFRWCFVLLQPCLLCFDSSFCFLPHLIFFCVFSLWIFSLLFKTLFFLLLLLFLLFDINHTFCFFDLIFGLTFVYCFVVFLWRSHQSWHFPFPLPPKSSLPPLFLFSFVDISIFTLITLFSFFSLSKLFFLSIKCSCGAEEVFLLICCHCNLFLFLFFQSLFCKYFFLFFFIFSFSFSLLKK